MRLRLAEEIEAFNEHRRKPGEEGMTQRRLAELVSALAAELGLPEAGITEARVSDHANQKRLPRSDTLVLYARVLRCAIDDLFSDDPDIPSVASNPPTDAAA